MENTPIKHEMGGGKTVQSVKLRGDWAKIIADAQVGKPHHNSRVPTEEEKAFIKAARDAEKPVEWDKICAALNCSGGWALKVLKAIREGK